MSAPDFSIRIDKRLRPMGIELRAKIDHNEAVLTHARATVANGRQREREAREKANQMADATRIAGRQA